MKFGQYLTESSLSRIWKLIEDNKYSFAVISAFESDSPDNEKNHKQLKSKIRGFELGFVELKSQWTYDNEIQDEKSLLVADIKKQDALNMCKVFNQESILWKDDKVFAVMDRNGKILETFKKQSGKQNLSLDINSIFSALAKGKHRGKKFTFNVKENTNMNFTLALLYDSK